MNNWTPIKEQLQNLKMINKYKCKRIIQDRIDYKKYLRLNVFVKHYNTVKTLSNSCNTPLCGAP